MKHRTMRGLTTLTLISALLLTACSSDDSSDDANSAALAACTSAPIVPAVTSDADAAVLAGVTVTGDAGTAATLTMTTPLSVSGEAVLVLDEGTGDPLVKGDTVTFQLVTYTGSDGVEVQTSWTADATSGPLNGETFPEILLDAVIGKSAGTRVLYAQPTTNQSGAADTAIYVVDILTTAPADPASSDIPTRAVGDDVTPAAGLPIITLDETGKPSLEIADGTKAPSDLVAQTLIQGAGATVASGDTVTFNYTGWTTDCTQFDSSWDRGTAFESAIGTGVVIKGWDQGLVGKAVGSQVLLFIPSALAYGESEGNALKDDDLIFVVDILATTPAA